MPQNRRRRPDGSEIDAVKDLESFVQSFPPTGQPDPPEPEPASPDPAMAAPAPVAAAPPPPVALPEAEPAGDEFSGKSPQELSELIRQERQRKLELEQQSASTRTELERERQQRLTEATVRRTFDEQQALRDQAQRTPPPPAPVDPRLEQIDQLWFSKPDEARQLLLEVQQDNLKRTLEQERGKIKQEVFTELDTKRNRDQGNWAFKNSMERLQSEGARLDADHITAVYTIITRPPTQDRPNQYYMDGGPLNPDVVVRAYHDLFGGNGSTTAPATPATPAAPPYIPIPASPPGSSRPAPAAAAPSQSRAIPIDAGQKRDIEYMAEQFGYDAEKMINRRRERLRKQQEEHS